MCAHIYICKYVSMYVVISGVAIYDLINPHVMNTSIIKDYIPRYFSVYDLC